LLRMGLSYVTPTELFLPVGVISQKQLMGDSIPDILID